jgi:dihydrofolate reductase
MSGLWPRPPGGSRFDTVLMGRGTYEVGLHEGVSSPYAHLRQYVVSTSLTVDDPAVEVISHDAVARVRKLKRQKGRGIWLCGGGKLAATLRDDIDELMLKINPVIIGTGIPLFDRGFGPDQFVLTASRVFNSGVAFMTYARR